MVGRNTIAIQPASTVPTRVDSARDIVLVRSKIRNNSANTPKRGLKLYRLNSAKNTTTIRPVTPPLIGHLVFVHGAVVFERAVHGTDRAQRARGWYQPKGPLDAVSSPPQSAQTSGQECVLQRAAFATGADMRRRPSLSIRWKHHCRRLFNLELSCVPFLLPCYSHF